VPSKKTAVAVAAAVLSLGAAGVGIAGVASADPTPTPSPSASASGTPTPGTGAAPDGRHGHGFRDGEFASELASKLGVSQDKVEAALQAFWEENRPTAKPSDQTTPPDPAARDAALAKALAAKLGVDEAKVTKALDEIRTARQAERAAALKTRLDKAVADGTLTQAEADAVTKAVQQGVINPGGPR
jgi:ABC-type amino acid transport substrate-binding protein